MRTYTADYPGHNFRKEHYQYVNAPWLYGPGWVPYSTTNSLLDFGLNGNRKFRSKDPDWKVLVMKRSDASGSYHNKIIKLRPSIDKNFMSYVHPNGLYQGRSSGVYARFPDAKFASAGQDDAALRDLALARLKRKLQSRSNQMLAIVPLVELREFRGLITSLTFSATDLMYALLKIKKTKGKSAAQFASHAWLNWSFAIKPTLSDIKQLSQTLDDIIAQRGGEMFTEYGAAKSEWNSSLTFSETACPSASRLINEIGSHKLSYRFVAGYRTPLRSANDYSVASDFSFEPGMLVPALWELTAFSWMFDYFTTMGAYLEDTFISDGGTTVYVNCTKKYTYTGYWDLGPPIVSGLNQGKSSRSGKGSSFEVHSTERTVYSALPNRILRFKTSDEIGKNAINKLLNLGSVLVGGKALSNRYL